MLVCDMNYSDWYDKIGYKIEEEIQAWLDSCPSSFIDIGIDIGIDIQDVLDSEYESLVGELQDREYQEFRERDI